MLPLAVDTQEQARRLYFEYMPMNEIATRLCVGTSTLSRWRSEGSWNVQRAADERALIEDGFSKRKVTIARIMNSTVEQVERGVQHILHRAEPPSLQETEKLSIILANLDKIGRLDAGKSTENVAVQARLEMNAEDIKRIILADPARAFEEPRDESP